MRHTEHFPNNPLLFLSEWWMDTKHDGLALNIDSTSCSRIPRQTRKYSLSILLLVKPKRPYLDVLVSMRTTRLDDAIQTVKWEYMKIKISNIHGEKEKNCPGFVASYFGESLCAWHNSLQIDVALSAKYNNQSTPPRSLFTVTIFSCMSVS